MTEAEDWQFSFDLLCGSTVHTSSVYFGFGTSKSARREGGGGRGAPADVLQQWERMTARLGVNNP